MSRTPLSWSCHSCSLCSTLDSYSLQALLMYKACTNHLTSYWSSMVITCSSVIGRSSLRSASGGKYVVPRKRLVFGLRSFTVVGKFTSIWNSLPRMSAIPPLRLSFALNWRLTSSALYLWILLISRLQVALLNFVRRAISNYSFIVYWVTRFLTNSDAALPNWCPGSYNISLVRLIE